MPLHNPLSVPERILVFGGAGAGKSHNLLRIAEFAQSTGSTARFVVIDTDNAIRRMMTGFDHLTNIEVHDCFEWPQVTQTMRDVVPTLTADDWLSVDLIDPTWSMVQEYFTERVFGTDIDEFFLSARAQQEQSKRGGSASPFDGWKDWCVDSATEILTSTGWKTYDQLAIGDLAWCLDPDTLTGRFEPVLDIYIGEPRNRDMIAMTSKSHSSLTTTDHRWLVETDQKGVGVPRKVQWRTTETLTAADRIPHAAQRTDFPSSRKHSDTFVALVAWFWTEGWVNRRDRPSLQGGIGQKKPKHVRAIRFQLTDVFGRTNESTDDNGTVTFRLNHTEMEALSAAVDMETKNPTYEFLNSLTEAQARFFIDTCIAGDGSRNRSKGGLHPQVTWFQNDPEAVRRFEFICAMAGIPTRTHKRINHDRLGQPESFVVSLLRTAGTRPANVQSKSASVTPLVSHDIVWCPSTPTQTWFAKRDGKVFFTGNTVINKMYRSFATSLLRAPCNVYATAAADAVNLDTDAKEVRNTFAPLGVKPRGQKHTPHIFHTILLQSVDRAGVRRLSTAKDRGRMMHQGLEFTDFVTQYLIATAGWRP